MCLSACWRTHRPSVHSVGGIPLVLAPAEGSASSIEPVCALSPNRPQPRPLWLQELALPCNVLILIKVQTGFYFGGGGRGGRSGMRRVLPSLTHIACPPFLLLFPPSTEDNALYRYHPHISHWGRAPSISPGERLPEDHPEPKMSFLRQRLKPSEQGLRARMPKPLLFIQISTASPAPLQPCLFIINIFFTSPSSSSCPTFSSFHSPCLSLPCPVWAAIQTDRWALYVKGSLGLGVVGGHWWEGLYGEELGFRHCLFPYLYIRMYI